MQEHERINAEIHECTVEIQKLTARRAELVKSYAQVFGVGLDGGDCIQEEAETPVPTARKGKQRDPKSRSSLCVLCLGDAGGKYMTRAQIASKLRLPEKDIEPTLRFLRATDKVLDLANGEWRLNRKGREVYANLKKLKEGA